MLLSEINKIWTELEEDNIIDNGFPRLRVEPNSPMAVYLAIEKPRRKRSLLFEVNAQAISPNIQYPQSMGFTLATETINAGPNGRIRLVLTVKEDRFKDVFAVLVKDIIDSVSVKTSDRDGFKAFINRLIRWQTFLKNHSPEGLSENERRGLYGELWFLYNYVLANKYGKVTSWVGPKDANQDFQFSQSAVEVKTTTGGPPEKVTISNVRQLDRTGVDSLILYHLVLDARHGGGQSLPQLIEKIRTHLLNYNEVELVNFNSLLEDTGYLDIHHQQYENEKYTLRHERFFLVDNEFPKITENQLMSGISEVRYTLMISACINNQISSTVALQRIWGT